MGVREGLATQFPVGNKGSGGMVHLDETTSAALGVDLAEPLFLNTLIKVSVSCDTCQS
jgi:hypothetical protein